MTLTPHPYADLLIAIAEGKQMQLRKTNGELEDISPVGAVYLLHIGPHTLSIKPEPPPTMVINGHVVRAPMRVAPERGSTYFTPCLGDLDAANRWVWQNDRDDLRWLAAGLCQATKQGAIDQAHALLSYLKEPS